MKWRGEFLKPCLEACWKTREVPFKNKMNNMKLTVNRPFHGFRRHLGWESVTAKITANVWEIVQLSNLVTPLLYNGV